MNLSFNHVSQPKFGHGRSNNEREAERTGVDPNYGRLMSEYFTAKANGEDPSPNSLPYLNNPAGNERIVRDFYTSRGE